MQDHHRALSGYQIGIAHITDAAALALQPFGVGDGVLAGHGRGVGLAHGEGLRIGPAMVHPAIAEQVAGVIDDGNGDWTVWAPGWPCPASHPWPGGSGPG